jgi:sigma-B regulation protein RsbU (phosphoserine phosphatase)
MKILIAEDDRVSRKVLEKYLESWGYEVLQAADGSEAWDMLSQDNSIPLLITDLMMPNMDGLELCRKARLLDRVRYLHVIMLTAKGEKQDLLDGMEAGADAFLTKPFDPPELQAQIRVAERIIHLEEQLAERLNELTRAHARMKSDLQAAANVQRSLLPQEPPEDKQVGFSWIFDSCDEVAGDMFSVFRLDEHNIGLYILDVSGHGVQAALLSVSICRALTPLPRHDGLLKRYIDTPPHYSIQSPSRVAKELNRRFPVFDQTGQYFTFLYGILHLPTRKFRFVRAGHPGPIHVHSGQCDVIEMEGGLPIGVYDNNEYPEHEIQLGQRDQIIFYTDGIEEGLNPDGEKFGLDRIIESLKIHHGAGIKASVKGLQVDLSAFIKSERKHDDMTIIGFGLNS